MVLITLLTKSHDPPSGTSSDFAGSQVTVQQLKLQSFACEAQHSVSYVGGSIRFRTVDDINPALRGLGICHNSHRLGRISIINSKSL